MATDPILSRTRDAMSWNPYSTQSELVLGKVVKVHPDIGTVDVALDSAHGQGGFLSRVPVLSWSYASQTGQTYMPSNIKLSATMPSAQGTYDQPIPSGEQDVWCVVSYMSGRALRPVVMGFLSPLDAQIHTTDAGYDVKLHESGVYTVTDPAGTITIGLPDGSSVVVGTSTTPIDMTTQNDKWAPKTTTTAYNITLDIKGNLTLTIKGDTTITTMGKTSITSTGDVDVSSSGNATIDATNVYLAGSGGQEVARKGDAVQVSTTTGIGTITGGSSKVYSN